MVRRLRELVARGRVTLGAEELPKLIHDAITIALVDAHLAGITHRVELDPETIWVEADPIQVQQVLINLMRNAVQAMEGAERRELLISTRALSPSMAEISVADTGCGFRPEMRAALFSPFQSSKEGGMGIGLSISRTIVEAHGGKIWAEDRPGGGALFRFTLRRAEPLGSVEADAAA
jgi:two-component system sensor kinase FixL